MRSTLLHCLALASIVATLSASEAPFIREYALGDPGCGPAIVAVDRADSVWVMAKTESSPVSRRRDRDVRHRAEQPPRRMAVAPDALDRGKLR
jgi:hypothetical protein